MKKFYEKNRIFPWWWRVVEGKNGGEWGDFVESGGDSPFFVVKTLENRAFFMEKILGKTAFLGCLFTIVVLQCG